MPQDCKINQGDVIQVDLGYINTSRFTTRNEMPDGYTPVNFDIVYDCGDTSSINNKMEMRIDGDDLLDQYTLVARRREADNTPDIGVRMARIDDTHINIPFTNGLIGIHPSGRGSSAWRHGRSISSVERQPQVNLAVQPRLPFS